MTMRDQIWNAALEQLVAKGKFKAAEVMDELDLSERQRQTVRRTLRQLEEQGWLSRESKQSGIWRLGKKGRMLLNVSEDTIDESRE
ncbi:BlaI/MecI/CopY family transcriptional regulator [Halopiger aswanensis]|uniref:Penicillinase repressor n=1 Tax=Halopiger aswanensis TaxID=148449 RepID=A0A3R7GY94_9EURY|nr:DeoR family transcriptional regulator [Halopiger aswanensis]RKD97820.1 penicillinase repressor [Halopiger aswanensis]